MIICGMACDGWRTKCSPCSDQHLWWDAGFQLWMFTLLFCVKWIHPASHHALPSRPPITPSPLACGMIDGQPRIVLMTQQFVITQRYSVVWGAKKTWHILSPFKAYWLCDAPTSLTFNNCTLCPHCIYGFCIYLRTNSDLYHLQHKLIGF